MQKCVICQNEQKTLPFCDSKSCILNIHRKLEIYTHQIQSSEDSIEYIVKNLMSEVIDISGIIYLCGVGKSGYIARKTIATWQSLGIRAQFLSPQDALHGDIGILRSDDMILYLSNSGNTEELIKLATYLQQKNIKQILLSNNSTASMNTVVDTNYSISTTKLIEVDSHGLVPSVSSTLYMIVLDMIGIYVAEQRGYKKDDFQSNHPSGDLGKKGSRIL